MVASDFLHSPLSLTCDPISTSSLNLFILWWVSVVGLSLAENTQSIMPTPSNAILLTPPPTCKPRRISDTYPTLSRNAFFLYPASNTSSSSLDHKGCGSAPSCGEPVFPFCTSSIWENRITAFSISKSLIYHSPSLDYEVLLFHNP